MAARSPIAVSWIAFGMLLSLGCGPKEMASDDRATTHLRVLGILYGQYMSEHGGAPGSQEQFAAYIEREPANWNKLAPTAAEFLTKGSNGESLVVRYGKDAKQSSADGRLWIAYQSTPTGGQRLAANAEGSAELLDDQRFAQLFPQSP